MPFTKVEKTNSLYDINIPHGLEHKHINLPTEVVRAHVWAKFCYPNDNWTSNESLQKLYAQHKMLCGKHFDNSSFTSIDRKRLNKVAIPTEAQTILAQLRDGLQCTSP
ncbi:hypothetical protein HF086_004342 [Spodoptera exigua]|uniref:THAP-type domain-containing protein n=1 Tax=Spodoptera exigua TaxID=7107 RepID=A0A922MEM5_SPOEX|nr:hypothetical protein HF086_004342 [Spodoptera exigua]